MKTIYTYLIVIVLSLGGGTFLGTKISKQPVINVPACPPCPQLVHKCPPSVKVQSIDMESVRKIKGGFTFAPVYNGDVYLIDENDTTKVK